MATPTFLGIDAGTQGLTALLTDQDYNVIATGEGHYDMVPGLDEGCYEQAPEAWVQALADAMNALRQAHPEPFTVQAIGISGQMHGEVLIDDNGSPLRSARLWCDARNESEGSELTKRFGVKMPKRITAARWLWTIRNHPELAPRVHHLTTPGGWLAYCLTGKWTLGVGDAAGMFPIDQQTLSYDTGLLASFDELVAAQGVRPLASLLPKVCAAGTDAGSLDARGAALLGLPVGIPVAPAEGDQPASLAGSLIAAPGMVSVSFGTSVCANSVGDRPFQGVSDIVDHFCAPDGRPINMVCLRNGTTFMNQIVEMFSGVLDGDRGTGFAKVMPLVLDAAPDCGGLLALPFIDDEPGLGVHAGGTASFVGLSNDNATPGNMVKSALLATMYNLRIGSTVLDEQQFPRTELVLSGGLAKTPALGQVLADVFDTPVTLLDGADEGCAWGAALLAGYRSTILADETATWEAFLAKYSAPSTTRFEPNPEAVSAYDLGLARYQRVLALHNDMAQALT